MWKHWGMWKWPNKKDEFIYTSLFKGTVNASLTVQNVSHNRNICLWNCTYLSSTFCFCFCHVIASFIILKIMQWLWTAHFSLTNQVCGIMIQWGLFTIKSQLQMYIHVGTAWRLKGHNPGLKGFRCVQLHNVWWQQIPIPHCSWEKWHLSGVNTTEFYLKCPFVCISRASTRWY